MHPHTPRQSEEGPSAWQPVAEAGFELRNALEMAAALVIKAGKGGPGGFANVKALFSGGAKDKAKAKEKFMVSVVLCMGGWMGMFARDPPKAAALYGCID